MKESATAVRGCRFGNGRCREEKDYLFSRVDLVCSKTSEEVLSARGAKGKKGKKITTTSARDSLPCRGVPHQSQPAIQDARPPTVHRKKIGIPPAYLQYAIQKESVQPNNLTSESARLVGCVFSWIRGNYRKLVKGGGGLEKKTGQSMKRLSVFFHTEKNDLFSVWFLALGNLDYVP